ncbi:hypothetical protein PpBr36_03479 [Pyricularia pennisetigena]|uniref:hypothetical protein n=1 Tax=Pyricularia pennisetigena TaxID=1578925 RepID=UPI001153843F|nr:hypothetical protein PpBr36_03479 [Pyricularia pennisetigena]TLS31458.1 hypothetical protein PpBr36_03479 [Pyricularia pennisetigena]
MTSPFQAFGLSCPAGGKFYVCETGSEFIGCCASDPCNLTGCPRSDLRTSSFSPDEYSSLPAQECEDRNSLWYTCAFNVPPFMGCCKTNPCADPRTSCPTSRLGAAKLSSHSSFRERFLHPSPRSSDAKPTSTSTSAPDGPPSSGAAPNTQGATPSPEAAASNDDNSGLSTGTIAGIAIGVSILVLVAIAVIIWKCGWSAGKRRARRQAAAAAAAMPAPDMTQANAGYRDSGFPEKSFPGDKSYRDSFAPSAVTVMGSPRDTVYANPGFDSSTLSMYGSPHLAAPATPAPDQRYSTYSQQGYNGSAMFQPNGYSTAGYSLVPNPSMPVVFEMDSTEVRPELSGGGQPATAPLPVPVQPPRKKQGNDQKKSSAQAPQPQPQTQLQPSSLGSPQNWPSTPSPVAPPPPLPPKGNTSGVALPKPSPIGPPTEAVAPPRSPPLPSPVSPPAPGLPCPVSPSIPKPVGPPPKTDAAAPIIAASSQQQ